MNKQRKLIWKYFLQQKLKEILMVVGLGLAMVFLPYYAGYFVGDNIDINCGGELVDLGIGNGGEAVCSKMDIWMEGLLYMTAIGFIIFILVLWVKSNWRKAKRKAYKH